MKYLSPNRAGLHVSNLHFYAEAYAQFFNLPVFPLVPGGKKPITPNGFKDATRDTSVIASWWNQYPNANIGLATGLVSGLGVLDIDPKPTANEVLSAFHQKFGAVPPTSCAVTGRGGYHLYFQISTPLPCRVGIIQGVDFRADGGYVVLPPSIHENGRLYQWAVGYNISEIAPISLPDWLATVIKNERTTKEPRGHSYFKKIIEQGLGEGRRNDSLTSIAGHLLARHVDPLLTKELILAFNDSRLAPPLPHIEVLRTLDSIAGKELKRRLRGGLK